MLYDLNEHLIFNYLLYNKLLLKVLSLVKTAKPHENTC